MTGRQKEITPMNDNQIPPPPGYYDDGSGQQRYWDGHEWGAAAGTPQPRDAAPAQPVSYAQGPATKQRNVLGIVALIVAVFGFIFACVPGALIVGWVALPIAFVLAVVALFMKGKGKALALTALIVSIVGTIVGAIVFFTVVGNSFSNAFGSGSSSVVQPSSSASTAGAHSSPTSTQPGTRDNPVAVGSQIKSNDYTVTINSVDLNANDTVMGANQFNDQPDAGTAYALINTTVTYTGKTTGDTSDVSIAYVTASGNVINSYDKTVVAPDPELGGQELYPGADATGNTVIQVPVDDNGLLRVRPGITTDEIFVKMQ